MEFIFVLFQILWSLWAILARTLQLEISSAIWQMSSLSMGLAPSLRSSYRQAPKSMPTLSERQMENAAKLWRWSKKSIWMTLCLRFLDFNFSFFQCRGFTLSYAAGKHINLQTMRRKVKDYVQNHVNDPITIVQPRIRKNRERQVTTRLEAKKYSVVYTKRRLLPDFSTLPYGYCDD